MKLSERNKEIVSYLSKLIIGFLLIYVLAYYITHDRNPAPYPNQEQGDGFTY